MGSEMCIRDSSVNETELAIDDQGGGLYLAHVGYADGATLVRLLLTDATQHTQGRLEADAPTARATIRYLLSLQDARDLPERVELPDVLAAYPDAVSTIAELRSSERGG